VHAEGNRKACSTTSFWKVSLQESGSDVFSAQHFLEKGIVGVLQVPIQRIPRSLLLHFITNGGCVGQMEEKDGPEKPHWGAAVPGKPGSAGFPLCWVEKAGLVLLFWDRSGAFHDALTCCFR